MVDLQASAERLRSARALAEAQIRVVESAADGADHMAVDLLFLLEESVLVLSETHSLLERLSAVDGATQREAEPLQGPTSIVALLAKPQRRRRRRAIPVPAALLLAFFASTVALEIIDPAPMDIEASTADSQGLRPVSPMHRTGTAKTNHGR